MRNPGGMIGSWRNLFIFNPTFDNLVILVHTALSNFVIQITLQAKTNAPEFEHIGDRMPQCPLIGCLVAHLLLYDLLYTCMSLCALILYIF